MTARQEIVMVLKAIENLQKELKYQDSMKETLDISERILNLYGCLHDPLWKEFGSRKEDA